jgi:two-component system nitrate/nitrite response regulator NarL
MGVALAAITGRLMTTVTPRNMEPGSTNLSAKVKVTVLLVDNDPISRDVLERMLRATPQVRVAASIDGHGRPEGWPLRGVDTVVLASDLGQEQLRAVLELTPRGIRVLIVGVGWTRKKLNAALASGASGCLIKDARGGGIQSAVFAMADGHLVISPRLWPRDGRPGVAGDAATSANGSNGRRSVSYLVGTLTKREREVLSLLTTGLSTNEVADSLNVSCSTVKSHVSHIITKFGVRNRLEAILLVRDTMDLDSAMVDLAREPLMLKTV